MKNTGLIQFWWLLLTIVCSMLAVGGFWIFPEPEIALAAALIADQAFLDYTFSLFINHDLETSFAGERYQFQLMDTSSVLRTLYLLAIVESIVTRTHYMTAVCIVIMVMKHLIFLVRLYKVFNGR